MNNFSCEITASTLFRFCTGLSVTVAPFAIATNLLLTYATWKVRNLLHVNLTVLIFNSSLGITIVCINAFAQCFYSFLKSLEDPCTLRITYCRNSIMNKYCTHTVIYKLFFV